MITLQKATLQDHPLVQNMARFYVYDMSKECGWREGWELPTDGLYESFDLKPYFINDDRIAYLIHKGHEVAGFAMINKVGATPYTDWNMGEFFILGRFQGQGVGKNSALQIFSAHPGIWNVMVMPCNKSAQHFWSKLIETYTEGRFQSAQKTIPDPTPHAMNVFEFRSF